MADITKRTTRKLGEHLEDGEQPVAALLVEPRGTYGLGAIAIAALPRTAGRKLDDRAAREHASEGGIAAGFPSRGAAVLVTDRRFIAAPSNGITFGAPALALARGSVKVVSLTRRGIGRHLELVFDDGSAVAVDAGYGQPFGRFAGALGFTE